MSEAAAAAHAKFQEQIGQESEPGDWFEMTQVRGQVKDGKVEHFQVGLKIGFRLEDE